MCCSVGVATVQRSMHRALATLFSDFVYVCIGYNAFGLTVLHLRARPAYLGHVSISSIAAAYYIASRASSIGLQIISLIEIDRRALL